MENNLRGQGTSGNIKKFWRKNDKRFEDIISQQKSKLFTASL